MYIQVTKSDFNEAVVTVFSNNGSLLLSKTVSESFEEYISEYVVASGDCKVVKTEGFTTIAKVVDN